MARMPELRMEVTIERIHQCPPDGASLTPCCERTLFDLPRGDRVAVYPELATCPYPSAVVIAPSNQPA